MTSALKSSFFVAVLAGLLAFPFTGFGLIAYSPEPEETTSSYAAVLGVSNIPVKTTSTLGDINIIHQEDLTLSLSADSEQKFYNVLPEEYVAGNYEIVVVVPNEFKDQGVTATLSKSDLTYDLEIDLANDTLEYKQLDISLLVIPR